MKNKTPFLSLLLAILIMCSVSMVVSASTVPPKNWEAPSISLVETEAANSGDSIMPEADIPTIQGEALSGQEASVETENEEEAAMPTSKSSNTPFFIGAGIAVAVFAGVALYCSKNGNKTL